MNEVLAGPTVAAAPSGDDGDASRFEKIELVWPGKDLPTVPRQDPTGRWHLDPHPGTRRLHPLVDLEFHGDPSSGSSGLVVLGDRLAASSTLRRGYPRKVTFSYFDVPRIEIDDKAAAFRGDATYAYSTWLSVLRAHLDAIVPLMSRAGVVAVHSGDVEEPFARQVLAESLGRENYVGTVVWQRSYGPRNMRGMKEFTATHDCIVLFAIDKSAVPAVGMRRDSAAAGFAHPDGDPRGPWRAAHKGARTKRAKSDFDTYVPPYRWSLARGRLPEGLWRINPLTGVIWGEPTEVGDFPLLVEVADGAGAVTSAEILLKCRKKGATPELASLPWVFDEIVADGPLAIATKSLPTAVNGKEYSAALIAEGGDPFTAPPKRPGSGRYWEFAEDTLRAAYARDMVDLGADGNVIARIKTYAEDLGEEVIQNQQTWWPAKARDGSTFTGFTQDATKHLKKLVEVGLIEEATTASKPEHLLARLLEIFTRPGELALEVFGSTADLAAVSLKLGRDFLYLAGASERDRELLERCALGRLRAVVDGADADLHEREGAIRMGPDSYLPYGGGGRFGWCSVGDWLFEQGEHEDLPRMNRAFPDAASLASAVLSSQGFLPDPADPFRGRAADGSSAIVVSPDEFLTPELCSQLIGESPTRERTILYFMAAEDFDPSIAPVGTRFGRVPSEIAIFDR